MSKPRRRKPLPPDPNKLKKLELILLNPLLNQSKIKSKKRKKDLGVRPDIKKKWDSVILNTEIKKKLYKQLFPWWKETVNENMIIIYKNGNDGRYPYWPYTREKNAILKKLAKSNSIKAILFGLESYEKFLDFIYYLPVEGITSLSPLELIKNYKKYFSKVKYWTDKDYLLKEKYRNEM